MREALKRRLRAIVPPAAIQGVKVARAGLATRGARAAFERAGPEPRWLDPELLPVLQGRYPTVPPYHYDPASLWMRGVERSRQVGRFLTGDRPRTLELACHDGMVSAILARDGARATAIDLGLEYIDPRVRESGVELVAANAEQLPFEQGQFDCVFSYNAFEHFGDPRAVLSEALRVVRLNGALYFLFGPLYRAAYGLHAFHAITVPFCHYLWERSVLEGHVMRESLGRINFETLNEWTVQQFRDLWAECQPWAPCVAYREIPELRGMELVRAHSSCFRTQTDRFEDLLVAILEVALRRTQRPFELLGPGDRRHAQASVL
jgi:SAM-dependent methyltransferase